LLAATAAGALVGCGEGDPGASGGPPSTSGPDASGAPDGTAVGTAGPDATIHDGPSSDGALDARPRDAGGDVPTWPPGYDAGPACASVVCPPGQACVNDAHGQALGVCVDICDCSNCDNCDYTKNDGRWNDQQEYCGNLNQQPATMRCNLPCQSAGQGCIYYGPVDVCWPLEGCFSAP
jgi:hypothetical protein